MAGTLHIEDAAPRATSPLDGLRIGYAPLSPTLEQPGDRRRFPYYAERRGFHFEIADPARDYGVVVVSQRADVVRWARHSGRALLVYDLIDAYLAGSANDWKSRGRGVAKYAIGEIVRPVVDYRQAIEAMCFRADAVVCSTPQQKRDIGQLSDNVHVVLDAHFELGDTVKTSYEAGPVLNLLWEGQAENIPASRSSPTRCGRARSWTAPSSTCSRTSGTTATSAASAGAARCGSVGSSSPASTSTSGTRTCSRRSRRGATSRSRRSTSARR